MLDGDGGVQRMSFVAGNGGTVEPTFADPVTVLAKIEKKTQATAFSLEDDDDDWDV